MFQRLRFYYGSSTPARLRPSTIAITGLTALLSAACLLCTTPAAAQGATSTAVSSGVGNPYKACTDGTTNEDRTTCLKEAGAAKLEAQRGNLTTPASAADQNALQRCDALPPADKETCRLRIMGAGTTSGSVAGGGVLREIVTVVPSAPTAPIAPDAPAPMTTPVPVVNPK